MKVSFGEYSAFTTKNNLVRYQKDGRLISENAVPTEVVAFLNKKLAEVIKFPMPSEEEKKRLREESLKVKPELQRDPAEGQSPSSPLEAERLAFEAQAEEAVPDFNPPLTDDQIAEIAESTVGTDDPQSNAEADFLEQVSIHTATIQDIAEALFDRFGLYTIYLNRQPEHDEINPLTGETFTKYHLGIAYQAAIYAKNKGILARPAELNKQSLEAGREAHKGFQVDRAPQTMAEARQANSFDYRTSVGATRVEPTTEIVHERGEDGIVRAVQRPIPAGQTGEFNGAKGRYNAEEDQYLVEPQFGRQVIRPDW